MNKLISHKKIVLNFLVVGCILISGCSTYMTKKKPEENSRQYFLPKGIISIRLERKEKDKGIDVTVAVKIKPDMNQKFFLYARHNPIYDDNQVIQINADGLLTGVNSVSNFKGEEILQKLGELAAATAQFGIQTNETADECIHDKENKPFLIEVEFDPYEGLSQINDKLAMKCFKIENSSTLQNKDDEEDDEVNGIIYRDVTSYRFTLTRESNPVVVKDFEAIIPDKKSFRTFIFDRGVFVSRTIQLAFENGLLVSSQTDYPSEVLGFILLPMAIVKGVSDATIGRFGMRTQELENETKFIETKNSLEKAKNGAD